jgi:hypothetical protein
MVMLAEHYDAGLALVLLAVALTSIPPGTGYSCCRDIEERGSGPNSRPKNERPGLYVPLDWALLRARMLPATPIMRSPRISACGLQSPSRAASWPPS